MHFLGSSLPEKMAAFGSNQLLDQKSLFKIFKLIFLIDQLFILHEMILYKENVLLKRYEKSRKLRQRSDCPLKLHLQNVNYCFPLP